MNITIILKSGQKVFDTVSQEEFDGMTLAFQEYLHGDDISRTVLELNGETNFGLFPMSEIAGILSWIDS